MAKKSSSGGDLFIVDNSDLDWKVKNYLHEWADIAKESRFTLDVNGFFCTNTCYMRAKKVELFKAHCG